MLESFLGYYVFACVAMLSIAVITLVGGIWYFNKRTDERLQAFTTQTINELNK